MAHRALTELDLEIVRGPRCNKKTKHAYVDKVPGLAEALIDGGFYKENFKETLAVLGVRAEKISPDGYGFYDIDTLDADQVLAFLTAIVEKDKYVEGFTAMCLESGFIEDLLGRLDMIDYANREIPSWIEDAASDILRQLLDYPSEAKTSSNRLIQPYLHYIDMSGDYRERIFGFQEEVDVNDVLRRKAKDFGLYLDSSECENMIIGTPGNTPFRVRRIEVGATGPKALFALNLHVYLGENSSIQIDEYVDEIECKISYMFKHEDGRIFCVSKEQVEELKAACDKIGVRKWEPEYLNLNVLDGEDWDLLINDEHGTFKSSGMNAYPDSFDKLLKTLRDLLGFNAR